VSKEDKVLRFMLPDLLGEPQGVTDKEGHLVVKGLELPPDCYVFFISIEEWEALKKR